MLADLRFVLFDAAGTLIRPVPDVAVVYQQVGARYGACLSRDVIDRRFQRAFRRHMTEPAAAERHTNEEIERLRWRQVVAEIFPEIDHAGLFRELWHHFARSENWQLFHDVEPAWRQLEEAGLLLGVASNFDRRLLDICQGLTLFSDCRYVFASTALGRRKPALQFFRRIEEHLGAAPEQIMLVGDDLLADWRGAQSAGWRAVLIDRNRTIGHHDAIHDLREIAQLLSWLIAGEHILLGNRIATNIPHAFGEAAIGVSDYLTLSSRHSPLCRDQGQTESLGRRHRGLCLLPSEIVAAERKPRHDRDFPCPGC